MHVQNNREKNQRRQNLQKIIQMNTTNMDRIWKQKLSPIDPEILFKPISKSQRNLKYTSYFSYGSTQKKIICDEIKFF